jgi:hypothetical protein
VALNLRLSALRPALLAICMPRERAVEMPR